MISAFRTAFDFRQGGNMTPTEVLSSIPAFARLPPDDLKALADRLGEARFAPGAVIVREGATDSASLYIIEEGSVEITRGDGKSRVELEVLGPGQYFGELALIDGEPRSASATAREPLHVLTLDRQEFVDFIHRDPDAATLIMAELARRLRHTNDLVSAATEDMQRLGGMEALDAPYNRVSIREMIQKRAGWLAILFLGEMLTATAMGHFEEEIERAVVLALFVPLIISSGGNSGSQGTSLIIRALALRELQLRDWGWVFGREIFTGLVLGTLLGAIGFARIVIWQDFGWGDYGAHYLAVAVTIWASLIGVVGFGSTAGSMLPFGLRKLGFDPATSSAPFVATLVDVTGLIIYFTIASIILRGLVL
jgi:CRP-like cAMP-binding protein